MLKIIIIKFFFEKGENDNLEKKSIFLVNMLPLFKYILRKCLKTKEMKHFILKSLTSLTLIGRVWLLRVSILVAWVIVNLVSSVLINQEKVCMIYYLCIFWIASFNVNKVVKIIENMNQLVWD